MSFVSARPSGFPDAKPRGTLKVVGKKKLMFHVGYTSLLKKRENCAAMARNIICGMRDVAGHICCGFKAQDLLTRGSKVQVFGLHIELGPLRMSPVTGMARLAGRILSSVHMGNFSTVTGMKIGDVIIQA